MEDVFEGIAHPILTHTVGGLDPAQPSDVTVKTPLLEKRSGHGGDETTRRLRRRFGRSRQSLDEKRRSGEPSKTGTGARGFGESLKSAVALQL